MSGGGGEKKRGNRKGKDKIGPGFQDQMNEKKKLKRKKT